MSLTNHGVLCQRQEASLPVGTLKVRAMKALPAWLIVLNIAQPVEEITLNSALWFTTSKSTQQ